MASWRPRPTAERSPFSAPRTRRAPLSPPASRLGTGARSLVLDLWRTGHHRHPRLAPRSTRPAGDRAQDRHRRCQRADWKRGSQTTARAPDRGGARMATCGGRRLGRRCCRPNQPTTDRCARVHVACGIPGRGPARWLLVAEPARAAGGPVLLGFRAPFAVRCSCSERWDAFSPTSAGAEARTWGLPCVRSPQLEGVRPDYRALRSLSGHLTADRRRCAGMDHTVRIWPRGSCERPAAEGRRANPWRLGPLDAEPRSPVIVLVGLEAGDLTLGVGGVEQLRGEVALEDHRARGGHPYEAGRLGAGNERGR